MAEYKLIQAKGRLGPNSCPRSPNFAHKWAQGEVESLEIPRRSTADHYLRCTLYTLVFLQNEPTSNHLHSPC